MRSLALLSLILGLAAPAWAQEAPPPPPPSAETKVDTPIDSTKLGVSLSRIQRGLFVAAARDEQNPDGMRLEFNVQVYGLAPKIEVLKGVDLFNGAVPGTAPSHGQMIEFWTPVIYRTPAMPISSLAFWAANQIWQKSKKTRCEEEIANYRALIMQGVSVSAPRCTQ
jgi:hypothetical protein